MGNPRPKRAVLAALRCAPNFSELAALPAFDSRVGRHFQRWLDQRPRSHGLAPVKKHRAETKVSEEWRYALERRMAHNVERTRDMLGELQRLSESFRSRGVRAASLKGFTLAPDFCDDACLRHQVDFDFLVDPDVNAAADALQSRGYFTSRLNKSGETCFVTPLHHIPTKSDDLYEIQRQRQVDLHTSIWEPCSWLPVEVPQNCLESAKPQTIYEAEFLSLSLGDKFLVQGLHAFPHSLRSWIRVSWMLEIARCMEKHQENATLWNHVMERAGSGRLTKRIFAFVLGLANRLFDTPIPSPLLCWSEASMSRSMSAWLDHFAADWAIADWPGSLSNLFLSTEFISDRSLRRQYWGSRLLPKKASTSLGRLKSRARASFCSCWWRG